ncbi:Hsp70 family protein [Luteolibacter flavescens]|uniref:Hsp70 family protein n=1 Tax=Luteolibacter flavescens TaxID=1859460 RepID=A0ABT3FJG3_9BACT|nr:Hsp70 family protein [Luteolibacter flavescens]MCW1883706.1 Hsp70 family protein [Luteolibacter flavescens]
MIGIDLGTTNSLVAVFENGHPRVLANELGEELTPSVVAVAEDGRLLVGRAAKDRLVSDPASGMACFKRDMGTPAKYRFGGKEWSPVTCSAMVLSEMKRIASLHLGEEVTKAVITVPAYFHDQQRQATVEAAKIAGLQVERIINEPTAAALAYGYRNPEQETQVLVFDLGGGTFDVTLLEIFDGVVEVKSTAGESRLGGEDYTDALCEWLEKRHGWVPDKSQRGNWRQRVEVAKRLLAVHESASVSLDGKLVEVTREEFKDATAAITARLRPVVSRCLRDAGITAADLNDVLMVGGASRMSVVKDFAQDQLKRITSIKLDPDRVVALGAAVQAGLCANDSAVGDIVLTDVCPHTLGVEMAKESASGRPEAGYFAPIIDRNTTVPVSRSRVFNTMHPQQEFVEVEVFQGEARMTKDNQRIGQVTVAGLRHQPGQKRPGEVDIRFSYDMNGILEVEVTVLSSGQKKRLVIEQRPGSLSKMEIEEAIARMQPLKLHPRDLLPNRARLERANRVFAELVGPARDHLNAVTDRFEAALESQDAQAIKEAAAVLDTFLRGFFEHEGERQPEPLDA